MDRIVLRNVIIGLLILFPVLSLAENKKPENIIELSKTYPIYLQYWQITEDKFPQEKLKQIPDSLWKSFDNYRDHPECYQGNWLIRFDIVIKDTLQENDAWGFFPFSLITAYEIYWDGNKIAQNGIIGKDRIHETAGMYRYNLLLSPHLLTSGKHSIILRLSNYHDDSKWKWYNAALLLSPYASTLKAIYKEHYQAFFVAGILLIPFLFNIFLFFARGGKVEHLLFGLFCLVVIADHMAGQVPMFFDIYTTYINLLTVFYRSFTVIANILFPAFLIYTFSFPKKTIFAVIIIEIIILSFFVNFWNILQINSLTLMTVSGLISLWALIAKREGSIIIFIGIVLTWAAYVYGLSFASLATIMAICTSISIARQFAKKEKSERDALLRSSHLENELLKKNINPHFLLNSLTSIIAWLRKDPSSAIKLIETLAEEFRLVSQISGLKLITVRQEIDLCKKHLTIMNYRKGSDFNLKAVDTEDNKLIPPMIFHTLIENGLSHGYEGKENGTFTIQQKNISDRIRYTITDDGDFTDIEKQNSTGLGIKYIKSRLEESYPGRWTFKSHQLPQGWETIIEIKD